MNDSEAASLHVPPGHFYSPIPSRGDVDRALRRARATGRTLPGIDLRESEQLRLLGTLVEDYGRLDLSDEPGTGRFYFRNTWFTYADAICYALMLMRLRPQRVVEVGCGFSSALALDIDERFLGSRTRFTFVDPDPARLREVTRPGDLDGRVVARPVQAADPAVFLGLRDRDILFVDSSHVVKAGSDVQYLIDDVLPALSPGVRIHFHDVFWPFEYPESWLRAGCAMNEAYAIRALLQAGASYRVELFNSFLMRQHREWLAEHMPLMLAGEFPTGGIWLRRT